MTVQLLYDKDCPNLGEARANLHRALTAAGLPASWTERELAAAPSPLRALGSPTVLVNGRDVAGADPGDAACCRVYEVAGGRSGAPPAELIARVLRAAQAPRRPSRAVALVLPAIGAALVPGLTCPACWPAYASLLSALGLPFLPTAPWLLPLTIGLLLVALAALAYRAASVVPVAVGLAASAVILLGKFVTASNAITWAGAALLVAASLLRRRAPASCPACAPAATARHGNAAIPSTEGR